MSVSRREELFGSLLFLLVVVLGWGPYVFYGVRENFGDRFALLIGAGFGAFSAGFIYDVAEKLIGKGKGIYAAVISVTFPPAGIIISQAPLLPEAALMFITSAALWFASRATVESRAENLLFLSLLSGISAAAFGFSPLAFLPLVALWLLHARAKLSLLHAFLAWLPVIIGLVLNRSASLPFAQSATRIVSIECTSIQTLLFVLPWGVWPLFAVIARHELLEKTWLRVSAIFWLAIVTLAIILGGSPITALGASIPLIALIAASLLKSWFDAGEVGRLKSLNWIALPTAAGLTSFLLWRLLKSDALLVGSNHAVLAVATGLVMFVPLLKDMRRWLLGMLAISGISFGALWFLYSGEITYDQLKPGFNIAPWLSAAALFGIAVTRVFFGKKIPKSARAPGTTYRFDKLTARSFTSRSCWTGEAVEISLSSPGSVRIGIFGDVTGSEFPFSSRRGGYFAFRRLISDLNERKPDVVICTGDLATNATTIAYRRLRVMLRGLQAPLLVTPGNHDLFAKNNYKPHYFHGLFGTDNGSTTIGNLRIVMLNTAWGGLSDEQFAWIESTLAAPHQGGTLLFCHKPLFDPREGQTYAMEDRSHAERLHEIFAHHRVTAVFSGHIHSLLHQRRDGVHYVISGGGGSKLKTEEDSHHYLWLTARGDDLTLEACVPKTGERLLTLDLTGPA